MLVPEPKNLDFSSWSQKLLDVGAGAKKFRFLELEPDSEI